MAEQDKHFDPVSTAALREDASDTEEDRIFGVPDLCV